ncbi:hypothetical protein, partial [Enterobacter hormaechei]|uniref:hypothetical protein n=1 Tax=Enterobacter hormaechei TaxID=158836 RepID=UPI001E64A08A
SSNHLVILRSHWWQYCWQKEPYQVVDLFPTRQLFSQLLPNEGFLSNTVMIVCVGHSLQYSQK